MLAAVTTKDSQTAEGYIGNCQKTGSHLTAKERKRWRKNKMLSDEIKSLTDMYLNKEIYSNSLEAFVLKWNRNNPDNFLHIGDVENVAEALFEEWESELEQYTNNNLRRASERKLKQTRSRYVSLISAMKRAEEKIGPVLFAFRDQVLFLKHNLNTAAVASLHDELASVETDIASLIKEMEASIAEADAFIAAMIE